MFESVLIQLVFEAIVWNSFKTVFTGERWQKMTDEEKAPYQKMAEDDKIRYTEQLEAFRQSKLNGIK